NDRKTWFCLLDRYTMARPGLFKNLTTEDATCDQDPMRASITACLVLTCWGVAAQQPAGSGIGRTTRTQQAEDWVLANRHLRVVLRSDNLTLSVEDLAAK